MTRTADIFRTKFFTKPLAMFNVRRSARQDPVPTNIAYDFGHCSTINSATTLHQSRPSGCAQSDRAVPRELLKAHTPRHDTILTILVRSEPATTGSEHGMLIVGEALL
ncbi:hypothetical protein DENSPDRAFT_842110 [Dentipellis sp. KUC8613]|nr:hypothetical protein DENSPDRAFT_842110 [Dentipellis sp. KUC8613]